MNRFCRECMSQVGLSPEDSKLALDVKYTTQNRLVVCDGPGHKCAIMVDPSGQQVDDTPSKITIPVEPVRAGHSLAR